MLPPFLIALDPNVYLSDNYVTVDIEVDTGAGDHGRPIYDENRVLLAVWRKPSGEYRQCWGNELELTELYDDMAKADFVVAHNSIYEMGWFQKGGHDISRILPFDTQLAEYVLLGNLVSGHADSGVPPVSISLEACIQRRGMGGKDAAVDIPMGHGLNPVGFPRKWLADRCIKDVKDTHELFLDQREALRRSNRLPVFFTRCILTPVLAAIQSEGMALDHERVKVEYERYSCEAARLEQELQRLTGGINTRSTKQLAEFLYDKLGFREKAGRDGRPKRTPAGKRITNSKVLATLTAETAEQREFIAIHRAAAKVNAAISKALNFFMGVCQTALGCVFYADFNQTRTATHRLSSSGIPSEHGSVQFQNLAREFKRLFKAKRDGWLLAETDGAGLEFRIAIELSRDKQGIQDLSTPGWDPHLTSLAAMEGRDYEELRAARKAGDKKVEEQRTAAKEHTFAPLFGKAQGTKKQERWYKAFRERYPDLVRTQGDWLAEVVKTKRLVTKWGMQFFFPNASMGKSGYVNVQNSVYNYPIQSFATADIIPISIVYLWHTIKERGLNDLVRFVNTVHDSVVSEIHHSVQDEYRQIAEECFTVKVYEYLKRVYGMDLVVKLGCETKIYPHWGSE